MPSGRTYDTKQLLKSLNKDGINFVCAKYEHDACNQSMPVASAAGEGNLIKTEQH